MQGEAPRRAEAATSLPDRIAFLGLGLIGGSIALAIREAGYRGTLAAWTPDRRAPAQGVARGVIDVAARDAEDAITGAGLVVLAGPPLAIVDGIAALAGPWRPSLTAGATVTDVGSTKARIVAAAECAALPFVGGHPMAGRETTGVASATSDLFVDRPWVLVPGSTARARDVTVVEALASATGARTLAMEPRAHDEAVAAISHLPLVVSAALVEAVALAPDAAPGWPVARELAAGGWRGMTRLAMGDPVMGAGILATNGEFVANRLRVLRQMIDDWIERIDPGAGGGDAEALAGRLRAARTAIEGEER